MITAIVVTHDRPVELARCLESIARSGRQPDRVLVVDNASAQPVTGVVETALPAAAILRLDRNGGRAGALADGIRRAAADGAEWVWLLADDSSVEPHTLQALLDARATLSAGGIQVPFLCSAVKDGQGRPCNLPVPTRAAAPTGYPRWADGADAGCVLVEEATSISVLVPVSTIAKVGLPLRDMFMAGDDAEFSRRMATMGPGAYVLSSRAIHHRPPEGRRSLLTDTRPEMLPIYQIKYRNRVYMYRRYLGKVRLVATLVGALRDTIKLALKGRLSAAACVVRGTLQGLSFAPKAEGL